MDLVDVSRMQAPQILEQMQHKQNATLSSSIVEPKRNIDRSSALYDQCAEFESLFVNIMLKSMRDTLNKEDNLLDGGQAEEIFSDMLYSEYSKSISKNSRLGLADSIYLELVRSGTAS